MRFTAVFFVLLLFVGLGWADKLEEQDQLQTVRKELKESKEKLALTRKQQQEVWGKLVVITQELKKANRELGRAKEKIQTNQIKISQLTVELRQTQDDLRQKSEVLSRRIREAYKSSRLNYLDLLFASRSMSDFFNRLYFFDKVIRRDAGLIEGVRRDLQTTKGKREVLSGRTQEIKKLALVVEEQKNIISEQAEEKKKTYDELRERRLEYERKVAELEASSHELEILIQRKVAERARAGITAHGSGILSWPLQGRLTSRFGAYRRMGRSHRHSGIDIAAPYGSPIVAADTGEVIFSGWWDGYGKALVIDHGRGRTTVYGHMSRIYLQAGAMVVKGQTIGLVGSTGYSTGPHLHFEVRKNGVTVNPMPYLK